MVWLAIGGMAAAQDPGGPDSLILGDGHVDSSNTYTYVNIPIFAVADEDVSFYNFPIRWNAPYGGVGMLPQTQYFPPLTGWDEHFDTVVVSQNFVRQLGWREVLPDTSYNPPLNTNGQRINAWTLRFVIDPNTRSQLVVLDTCYDPINESVLFGMADGIVEFTPHVQRGFISIGWVGVDDDVDLIPDEFALKQNYPNPFNPETNIEFSLPTDQDVSLVVYNLLGQEVRTLVQSRLDAGSHMAHWDGKNERGADVPSGVYFYRFYTPEFSQTNKMILVR